MPQSQFAQLAGQFPALVAGFENRSGWICEGARAALMNDQLTEQAKSAPGKVRQTIITLTCVGVFFGTAYSLFEAYWIGEVFGCGRVIGCHWIAHQDDPIAFFVVVICEAVIFLLFGYIGYSQVLPMCRKIIGK